MYAIASDALENKRPLESLLRTPVMLHMHSELEPKDGDVAS